MIYKKDYAIGSFRYDGREDSFLQEAYRSVKH